MPPTLLNAKHVAAARAVFERYHSLQAQIGLAFADWPGDGLATLQTLAAKNPDSPVAQYHLGWALYWSGRVGDAAAAWNRVDTRFPDSPESVEAENQLYPSDQSGLPDLFLPVTLPQASSRAAQLRVLATAAPPGTSRRNCGTATSSGCSGIASRPSASSRLAARLAPHNPYARDRGGCRPLHEGAPRRAFLTARPADGDVPARARRPLRARSSPHLDRATEEGSQAAPARGCRGSAFALRESGTNLAFPHWEGWDQVKEI